MCVTMAVLAGIFTSNNGAIDPDGVSSKAFYIYYTETTDSVESPILAGLETYGAYFILLNSIIPISLVVTLEVVKVW
jgi:hypothetical protein